MHGENKMLVHDCARIHVGLPTMTSWDVRSHHHSSFDQAVLQRNIKFGAAVVSCAVLAHMVAHMVSHLVIQQVCFSFGMFSM